MSTSIKCSANQAISLIRFGAMINSMRSPTQSHGRLPKKNLFYLFEYKQVTFNICTFIHLTKYIRQLHLIRPIGPSARFTTRLQVLTQHNKSSEAFLAEGTREWSNLKLPSELSKGELGSVKKDNPYKTHKGNLEAWQRTTTSQTPRRSSIGQPKNGPRTVEIWTYRYTKVWVLCTIRLLAKEA